MVGDGLPKNQNQRKRRQESCINNVKLNSRRPSRQIDNSTYTKKKLQQGSLEDVSRNPWGGQSSLRRTRSLAITREDVFYNLDITNTGPRRSQLIPRAKLIEKSPRHGIAKPPVKTPSPLPSDSSDVTNLPTPKFIIGDLNLPNYYPDTDTNISSDDISNITNISNKKFYSADNISIGEWTGGAEQSLESFNYDENIVLSANRALYDSAAPESHYAKPRTIRGPTPYRSENQIYYNTKKSLGSSSSESSEDKIDRISLDYFETDSNFDEIKLNNEKIRKVVEEPEQYKTVVAVASPDQREIEEEKEEESKNHSHNYLREFLESQKGSKKPLQNFLAKKFLSRKSSPNLLLSADTRYHSLPDITATKNLRKCEKIDRKLRKCQIENNNNKKSENRFIINIGRHFDIGGDKIPVDFELKIAKIPKKTIKQQQLQKEEEEFCDAVKILKQTLKGPVIDNNNNNKNNKPEIVSVQHKEPEVMAEEFQEKSGTMRSYWSKLVNGDDDAPDVKCKIVDVQTKIKKFEPAPEKAEEINKVQLVKKIFESPPDKCDKKSKFIKESCSYFENDNKSSCQQFESLNPNAVEIVGKTTLSKSKSVNNDPEFDHVRYRVVKSDLFQKKIFANCEKESQFDGLMQYLQDYSFQELLRDNNIVIIEPIRTKIPHEKSSNKKIIKCPKNLTPLLHNKNTTTESGLKRHFFYHPIRVNKEVNDDELPNPDTVKQVRQFFELGLKKSYIDPDKDLCSVGSTTNSTNMSDFCEIVNEDEEELFDSINYEQQFVSEDILKKIRDRGTTVTYYGNEVTKQTGHDSLTKVIMEEIKNNELKTLDSYQGVKFRLVKSNSCNSRLELVGTNDLTESKNVNNRKLKNVEEEEFKLMDKNAINENIKKGLLQEPKIIGEERKTSWGDFPKNQKTFKGINFSERQKVRLGYHGYESLKTKGMKMDDMKFEAYEVA